MGWLLQTSRREIMGGHTGAAEGGAEQTDGKDLKGRFAGQGDEGGEGEGAQCGGWWGRL